MEDYQYDKEYCQITFLEDVNCVFIKWIEYANFEQVKESCNFSLELLIEKQTSKMIVDNRKGKALPVQITQWLTEDWFPRAYEEAYRVSALIESEDIFNEVMVEDIVEQMDKDTFTVQYFKDLASAKDWIQKLKIIS